MNLKVVDVRPANIPVVQARELKMDNLFELEDGSVAILDYESAYKKENNRKEVAPEDVLSDTLYYYSQAKDCIIVAREVRDADNILW